MAAKKASKNIVAGPDQGIEITLVCEYEVDDTKMSEVAALAAGHWSPATKDFVAVAGTPNGPIKPEIRTISNLREFISAITLDSNGKPRKPRSVRRVNIIGHGEPALIGLSGTVNYDTGAVGLGVENTADYLSGEGFGRATTQWLNKDDEGIRYRDQMRKVLTNDAEVALVMCDSGALDGAWLMETMSETFIAKVSGYLDPIVYHPGLNSAGTAIVERRQTSIGEKGQIGLGYRSWVPAAHDGKHLEFNAEPKYPVRAAAVAAGQAAWVASHIAGHLPIPTDLPQ
jgi:hypothetical protein